MSTSYMYVKIQQTVVWKDVAQVKSQGLFSLKLTHSSLSSQLGHHYQIIIIPANHQSTKTWRQPKTFSAVSVGTGAQYTSSN